MFVYNKIFSLTDDLWFVFEFVLNISVFVGYSYLNFVVW